MQSLKDVNQEQILKKLAEDFLIHQQGKVLGKIVYPLELRKRTGAAVVQGGVSPSAIASACRVSVVTVRGWVKLSKPQPILSPPVTRLQLERKRPESSHDFAVVYLSDRVRIEIPVARLSAELLSEIIAVRIRDHI